MTHELMNPLTGLTRALDEAFNGDPKGSAVPGILEAYTAVHTDWLPFRNFVEGRYTRSLVRRSGDYELLLLCWGAGVESPVHNHMGQRCWMSVVEGEVEEVHFRRQEDGPGPLIEGPTKRFRKGQAAFIQDEIALHLVRGADGKAAASLHVYSKPYDVCLVYDRDSGEESAKPLTYDRVEGALVGDDEA
jgi:hypothetical protein